MWINVKALLCHHLKPWRGFKSWTVCAAWSPHRKKYELKLKSVERRATEGIKVLKQLSCKERFLQFEDEKAGGAGDLGLQNHEDDR